MGELHLEIIRDRLFREFKVEANAGTPQIAYRETITKSADGEGKFIRSRAVAVNTATSSSRSQPNERGKGVEIENKIVGGAIPKEYIAGDRRHRRRRQQRRDCRLPGGRREVAIIDGTFHEVDSNELAFKMAGIFAMKDAVKKANPILLEPIMKVEVTTPEEYQGDLMGDFNRRRGQIKGIENKARLSIINAEVPLAKCSVTRPRSVRCRRPPSVFDGRRRISNRSPRT